MKTISLANQARLLSSHAKVFFLVGIETSVLVIRSSTLSSPTLISGEWWGLPYKLVSLEPPRYSDELDRATYQIQFSDPDQSLEALLAEYGFGAKITVFLGFFDTGTGLPVLNDFVTIYRGYLDTMASELTDEEHLLTVKGTSPMGALDSTRTVYSSGAYVRQFNPADTSMDYVGETNAQEVKLYWGRLTE